jgi:hypothetical protein
MRVNIGELGILDMYSYYKENTESPLPYKEYKKIVDSYMESVANMIIDEGYNFRLPSFLGYFRIRKNKINYDRLSIDWGTLKKTGIKTYHLNSHSDGYKIKFLWEKKRAIMKTGTKRPYSFVLSRDLKRRLAQVMKTPNGHMLYAEEIINIKQKD